MNPYPKTKEERLESLVAEVVMDVLPCMDELEYLHEKLIKYMVENAEELSQKLDIQNKKFYLDSGWKWSQVFNCYFRFDSDGYLLHTSDYFEKPNHEELEMFGEYDLQGFSSEFLIRYLNDLLEVDLVFENGNFIAKEQF